MQSTNDPRIQTTEKIIEHPGDAASNGQDSVPFPPRGTMEL
jgi:hypothetical protein